METHKQMKYNSPKILRYKKFKNMFLEEDIYIQLQGQVNR